MYLDWYYALVYVLCLIFVGCRRILRVVAGMFYLFQQIRESQMSYLCFVYYRKHKHRIIRVRKQPSEHKHA